MVGKILLGVLLFLLLLCLIPVYVCIVYDGEVTLGVRALGIRIPILPKKKKKIHLRRFSAARVRRLREQERLERLKKLKKKQEAAKKKKAAAEQKKKEKQKQLPPPEVSDEPGTIRILLRIVGDVLDTFFGRLRVKMLRLRITVGASDAAKTAIMYGIVSQGVACLMELVAQKTRYRRVKCAEVEVVPDYLAQKTTADVDLRFGLSLADLIVTGVKLGVRFLREKYPVRPRVDTKYSKRSVERRTIQKG